MNRLEKLKRSLFVGSIMYRKEIRKKLLKIIILLNGVLFFISLMNNMPSMVLFVLNMFYLYKYMKSEYLDVGIKKKDRYNGIIQ